jgi:hypothetical protein
MHAGTIRHLPEAGHQAIREYYLRHYLTVAGLSFPGYLMTAGQIKGGLQKKQPVQSGIFPTI